VFEAGLAARGSEPAGSHTGDPAFPATTTGGTISFTSPLVDAGICQGGLRNSVIDRKPFSPGFTPRQSQEQNCGDSKKLHSASRNQPWFPHLVEKTGENAYNIIKYILEMVNKVLTRTPT